MTKIMFRVETDEDTGRKVVKKVVDELTKNHRLDKETSSGIMPEIKGSIYCPVLSFGMYLSKLHPECDRLWQRPKESFLESDAVWFCNVPVGEKKLRSFLSSLSKAINLSKVYTNHSIRATGASILSKCMYGPSQVMSVTGHESVQCLGVYQQVSDAEKIQMGESISENLAPTSSLPMLPSTKRLAIMANSSSSSTVCENQIVECDLSGWQIDQLFADFETQSPVEEKRPFRPICFSNCTVNIGNINVNTK